MADGVSRDATQLAGWPVVGEAVVQLGDACKRALSGTTSGKFVAGIEDDSERRPHVGFAEVQPDGRSWLADGCSHGGTKKKAPHRHREHRENYLGAATEAQRSQRSRNLSALCVSVAPNTILCASVADSLRVLCGVSGS